MTTFRALGGDDLTHQPAMTRSMGRGRRDVDVDGGWAWMVLVASFMNLLLASGIAYVAGIFQKLFLEQFGQSVAYTAWVTALFSSFQQLGGPASGWLTSLTNCRLTVMVGGALLSGGLAASSFATSLRFLLVSFGLVAGLGLGLMYTASIVVVNFFFERKRTVMMGVALSAGGIGVSFTPLLSRFLIDQFSWQETMMILAAMAAHVCVFGAVMFPVHETPSPCLPRLPESQPPDLGHDCDVKVNPVDILVEDMGVLPTTKNLDGELQPGVDAPAERAPLLGKTQIAENPSPKLHVDKHVTEFSRESESALQAPGLILGSGQSLNAVPHQMNGSGCSWPHAHRRLSRSFHHLDRVHGAAHEANHPAPARSLLTLGSWQLLRGSHLDVLAISLSSSVHSLKGGGPLTSVEVPDSSLDLGHPAESEQGGGGGGGGGGDWMVLKNMSFLVLCLNMFLGNMAIGIFNIHLPVFSQERGINDQQQTLVYAMFGAGMFVSRVLLGALGNDDRVDKVVVYFGLHLISSFIQIALPFTQNLAGVAALTFLMGAYYTSIYSLVSALTIDIVGLNSLAFAFGLVMVSAGLGYLVAPPLAGWIVDETGDYDNSMYFGGLLMFLSALSPLFLTCARGPGAPPIGYHPQAPDTEVAIQPDQKEQNGIC